MHIKGIPEKILRLTESRADEQLRFVMDLTRQNSYSWNKAGTDALAEMILERLAGALPTRRVVEQTEVGNLHLLTNAAHRERSIYILAHMDTVFPPEHPFRECRVEEGRLHGPGAGDMKAGVAAAVYAVLALAELGFLSGIPLTLILAGDEEVGAFTSRPIYEEERKKALACVVVEGGGPKGEVVLSRYGKIGARLESRGRDAHVGDRDLKKASAILELSHKIIGLEGLNGVVPGARLNVGKIEGGLGPATVPAGASAQLDIRWPEQDQRDFLVEKIRGAVDRLDLPECRSGLTILNERPAWAPTEGTRRMAELVRSAGAELGQEIGEEHRLGTSDSNFFGAAGVPTLDGLGPICKGYHTREEFVYISSIRERTALLANALLRVNEAFGSNPDRSGDAR
ncbi:MAG: M20/M25/M40 family metallo-hydrolase [Longimicrobiales bacterium]